MLLGSDKRACSSPSRRWGGCWPGWGSLGGGSPPPGMENGERQKHIRPLVPAGSSAGKGTRALPGPALPQHPNPWAWVIESITASSNALGGTFRGHPAHPPCSERGHLQGDPAAPSPVRSPWNIPRDGASPTSPGSLGQGSTTLIVKNFVLRSSLNLPCLSLKPLLRGPATTGLAKDTVPLFPVAPLSALKSLSKVSPQGESTWATSPPRKAPGSAWKL